MSVTNECSAVPHARFTHTLLQFISTVISERYTDIFYGFVFHKVTKYIKAWVKSPKIHNRRQERACVTSRHPRPWIANEIPRPEPWQLSCKRGGYRRAVAGVCLILWLPPLFSNPAGCGPPQHTAILYQPKGFFLFFSIQSLNSFLHAHRELHGFMSLFWELNLPVILLIFSFPGLFTPLLLWLAFWTRLPNFQ